MSRNARAGSSPAFCTRKSKQLIVLTFFMLKNHISELNNSINLAIGQKNKTHSK